MKTWKKLVSCLLVLSMIASMFVVVTAEEAGQPEATAESTSYDNCTDENGNLLNPYFVNNDIWVEENGGIKMPENKLFSFLLFDTPLTTNRVEATFEDMSLSGSGDDRNGIVFALTDHNPGATLTGEGDANVSYYWAFITGWGGEYRVAVLKMGKYNGWEMLTEGGWGTVGKTFTQLGIENSGESVTLAAEWDNAGNIKVFVNGTLAHEITDTTGTPLTGNLYGVVTRRWANSPDGNNRAAYTDTLTSFVAGDAKLAITATADEGGTVAGGADNFYRGQSATVTATPEAGYNFVGWYENDQLVSSDLAYTFKVTGNRDLVAKFTQNTYTVTVTPEANGTATGGGSYGEGASVTVTATPNAGYKFAGWYENDVLVSSDAAYTFTVTAARNLTAKFEKVTYSIAVDGEGTVLNPYFVNGNTWTEADGAIKPAQGAMENFILFDNALAVNRVEATFRNLPHNYDGDTRNGIVFALTDIDNDHAFGINAADVSYYWACVSGYGEVQLIGFPDWKNYTTGGSVDLTTDVTLAVEWDAEGNVKVFANGELRIEKNVGESLTGNLYGVLMRSWSNTEGGGFAHAHTVTSFVAGGALATPDMNVTVTIDPTEGGSVTGAGDYYLGQEVTLTATPNEGYTFDGWYENGELVSSEATITFAAADRNLTAKFISFEEYPQVNMGSAEVEAGKEVVVTLLIKNNPGIAGLVVTLKYDDSVLTLKDAVNGELFSGFDSALNIAWDESFNVTGDGILVTLTFAVAEGAAAGDYTVEVVVRECVDENGENIDIMAANGTITVTEAAEEEIMYGDVNGDETIDVNDLIKLAKYLSNYDPEAGTSTETVGPGADTNGTETIDVNDLIKLAKYLSNYDPETGTSTEVLGPQ